MINVIDKLDISSTVEQKLLKNYLAASPATNKNQYQNPQTIAIGSGKGGVGKTLIAANIGYHLAQQNKKVIIVDFNLSSPCLHTFFNIEKPKKTLKDLILNPIIDLNELTCNTDIKNLKIICSSADTLGILEYANLMVTKLIKAVHLLRTDFVIFDLGTGLNSYDINLFLHADRGLLVGTPEPTSMMDNFNFLKFCLLQKLKISLQSQPQFLDIIKRATDNFDSKNRKQIKSIIHNLKNHNRSPQKKALFKFAPKFILNMVHDESDYPYALALESAVKEIFGIQLKQWGSISYCAQIRQLIMSNSFSDVLINSNGAHEFYLNISKQLINSLKNQQNSDCQTFIEKNNPRKNKSSKFSNTLICSSNCSLWNNCVYQQGGHPCKIKYIGFINTN